MAGPDQKVQPGDTVSLDGTPSGDADRDPLSYQWSLVARPYGSATALASASQARATFLADVPGTYVATLTVSDGDSPSAPATTVIQVGGAGPGCSGVLPVASAGPDQTLSYRGTVYLSGTGSRSGGAATLSYRWSLLSVPAQSHATLDASSGVSVSFWPDRAGVYVASLIVNDGCADSAPSTVKITVPDQAPTASAGYATTIPLGASFTLDGWGWDPDGDTLTYQWTVVSPPGSSAALSSTTIIRPTFTPDLEGQYVFSLVVNDGTLSSSPSTLTVTAANQPPVASAGADQAVAIGAAVMLDGSVSSDPNKTPLSFAWTLAPPSGSAAVLAGATSATPSFVADVAGVYAATLVVSDGVKIATAKVSVSAWPRVTRLQARVVDADYSAALDKVVLVSNDPALTLLDPRTLIQTSVALLAAPTSVSVSPNGLFAAVGHVNAISYVDLTKATATRVALNGSAAEVALADDGYVYALSAGGYDRMQLFAVSTASGVETDALATLGGPPIARLRPGAASLYVTGSNYSSAIQRYDVAQHLPVLASMTSSSLPYGCAGGLWMLAAGDRLLTRCGTILRASSSPLDDLTSVGALWPSSGGWRSIRHASSSATEISCVATSDVPYSSYDDRSLRRFAADTLELRETAMFPLEAIGGTRYPWSGRFVFYRSDGTERYVIMQLDSNAGQAQDFGIATY